VRRTLAAAAGALLAVTVVNPVLAQDQGDRVRVIVSDGRIRGIVRRIEAIDNSQRIEETATTETVVLNADVLFDLDQATLTTAALARLETFATEIAAEAVGPVTIVGHTDSLGTDEHNQGLSEARAESVRADLAGRLGPGFTLQASGKGETEPVAPNQNDDGTDNPDGRARNRRVEISYQKSGGP
jgi:OOP family OmpA-OmpF porin